MCCVPSVLRRRHTLGACQEMRLVDNKLDRSLVQSNELISASMLPLDTHTHTHTVNSDD